MREGRGSEARRALRRERHSGEAEVGNVRGYQLLCGTGQGVAGGGEGGKGIGGYES